MDHHPEIAEVPSNRSYQSVLRPLRRAIGMVWAADARSTMAVAGLTLINGMLPVSQAWVAKLIIDSVLASVAAKTPAREGFEQLLPYLSLELIFVLTGAGVAQFRRVLDEILDHKIGYQINSRIIQKALRLELHHFENAEFYDKMQTARRQSEYRAMAIVTAIFGLTESAITLGSFLTLLVGFNPWVAVLLFGAALPAFVAQNKFSQLNFRLQSWKAPETRRMTYLEHLLTVDSSAKEIQTFSLGDFLLGRHADLFWKVFREDARLAWRRSWVSLGWGLLSTISYYSCYAWVIFRTLSARIGVIFQDFVKYQLTLRENVGFGSVPHLEDQARLERAADQGGMNDLIPELPEGWATNLGGWFQKGRELSGGQWQKIALSRAFMREGEVVILDEPTSALDAEKEYEIFHRFKDLTAGKIALLISHRFSTVRMADRIVVLRSGKVEELGSHLELLQARGTYARLFELQAEGYR